MSILGGWESLQATKSYPLAARSLPVEAGKALLATGRGRIVITAGREDQVIRVKDGQVSVFTQALVNGLSGIGLSGNNGGNTYKFDRFFLPKLNRHPDRIQVYHLVYGKLSKPTHIQYSIGGKCLPFDSNQEAIRWEENLSSCFYWFAYLVLVCFSGLVARK